MLSNSQKGPRTCFLNYHIPRQQTIDHIRGSFDYSDKYRLGAGGLTDNACLEKVQLAEMETRVEEETGFRHALETDLEVISHFKTYKKGISYRKFDCNTLLISVLPEAELHFSGKCKLLVLKGTIDICGFELDQYNSQQKYQVFSPKGYSLLSIRGVRENNIINQLHIPLPLPDMVLKEELKNIPGAVFLMEGFENEWCKAMRMYCLDGKSIVGPHMTGIGPGRVPKLKFFNKNLGFSFNKVGKNRLFYAPSDWQPIVTSTFDSSKVMLPRFAIFGGKGVGKSTLTRWLTNRLLGKWPSILYIDLDPGQSEFTPPHLISVVECKHPLLGTNFTNVGEPLLSLFVESLNVSSCPRTYVLGLDHIRKFIADKPALQEIPWIVNTMGFTQGFGVDYACETIRLFQPTDVVQIMARNQRLNFQFNLDYETILHMNYHFKSENEMQLSDYQFHAIDSVCESEEGHWGINSADLRNNVIVSYFAEQIGLTEDTNLAAVVPFNIPLSSVAIGTEDDEQSSFDYESILRVMNGNLVALCKAPEEFIQATEVNSTKTELRIKDIGKELLTNLCVQCLGFGFVRAIDSIRGLLHVVTPVSPDILKTNLNAVIVTGSIGVPIQFYVQSAYLSNPAADDDIEIPYVMNIRKSSSKLHQIASKNFVPKRVRHNDLKNCLL